MAAIITKDLRLHNAKQFKEAVSEAANTSLYVFVGKPDSWSNESSPPTPTDNYISQVDVWDNMIALKRVQSTDIEHVIPRRSWNTGTVYYQYDDSADAANLFSANLVIINSELSVYKCLSNNNGNPSTVEPTSKSTDVIKTSDNYIWKYMYTLGTADYLKFATTSFIPVREDANVKANAANVRGIYAYRIASSYGNVYVSGSINKANIHGDGSGANANIVVSSNIITQVNATEYGNNYTVASIVALPGTGTSAANIIPIVAPPKGHGYDAVEELGAYYVMVNSRLEQSDTDIPVTGVKFRQIGLLKDPKDSTGNILYTATLKNYKRLYVPTLINTSVITSGNTVTGGTTKANATIINYSSSGNVINIIQKRDSSPNVNANFTSFSPSTNEAFTVGGVSIGSGNLLANADLAKGSGEIMYVDNRTVITRASDQVESLYLIVEF